MCGRIMPLRVRALEMCKTEGMTLIYKGSLHESKIFKKIK